MKADHIPCPFLFAAISLEFAGKGEEPSTLHNAKL
jgi:hypothetical protein